MSKALLVIDMQNGVCKVPRQIYQFDHLVEQVNARIRSNRQANNLIVFIHHCNESLLPASHAWQLIPELASLPSDIVINKHYLDSFHHTRLQSILKTHQIDELEICGAQTEYCVDTAVKVAHHLGYKLTMWQGATSTFDNQFMTAKKTISFYEQIWDKNFLTLCP